MKIGIINIGDELLSGKILNSNQFDLSRLLQPLGHSISFGLVVGDDVKALGQALDWVLAKSASGDSMAMVDILVLTGGLGPTRDDLTREAVASYLKVEMQEDAKAMEWLSAFLKKPAAEIPLGQRVQATVPAGTEALRNPVGTACGFRGIINGIPVYAFPGVPAELKTMAALHLLPALPQTQILLERSLWTFGWSEGSQSSAFASLKLLEPFRFSSLPNQKGVNITLSCLVNIADRESRERDLDFLWQKLIDAMPPEAIVDLDGAPITLAVQKLLQTRKAKVSVAESCTGGGLAVLLTELPGSSEVFEKGYLTYSNQAKTDLLGVDAKILAVHGAVSEETALAMLQGCLNRSGADYACAITGIAGPGGGSEDKPVGSVWIAVGSRKLSVARRFHFRGNRSEVRSRSSFTALNLLRLLISEKLN
jgi:nicotinamide-nucleotide amidase